MTPTSEDPAEKRANGLIDDGNRLQAAGQLQDARLLYIQARECAPKLPRAHLNVGNIQLQLGNEPGAIAAFEAALALNPSFASAHFNLGNLHLAGHRVPLAIACYQQALQARPDFVDAMVALGNAHYHLGQWDGAAAAYSQALALKPDYGPVHLSLGNVLTLKRKYPEAQHALRQAMRLLPGSGAALIMAYYVSSQLCDWSRRVQDENALIEAIDRGDEGVAMIPLSILNIEPLHRPAPPLQRSVGAQFARNRLVGIDLAAPSRSARSLRDSPRLRIGYLSADIYDHPVTQLLKGVLAAHDRSRTAIHVYSYGAARDAVTAEVSASVETFRDVSALTDAQAAESIARDDIDILVHLQGYTENVRIGIAARRPASVLVSWLGYPATLGHPALADYIIGDPVVTPLQAAADFSETLALLPHCYLPNDHGRPVGKISTRGEAGLPAKGIVFCNFNQPQKFTPAMFDLWCRLLREVPDSVLWLREALDPVKANIRREALSRGVDAARLVFAPRTQSNADHLARLALADLALDTFPYTSHTTACDALWVGVPLVTIRGSTFTSRVAASVLESAGMGELVTADAESCFALAASLARDTSKRSGLREKLLGTRLSVPLFDTPRFTRNLEDIYARMWDQHRNGRREAIPPRDQYAAAQ